MRKPSHSKQRGGRRGRLDKAEHGAPAAFSPPACAGTAAPRARQLSPGHRSGSPRGMRPLPGWLHRAAPQSQAVPPASPAAPHPASPGTAQTHRHSHTLLLLRDGTALPLGTSALPLGTSALPSSPAPAPPHGGGNGPGDKCQHCLVGPVGTPRPQKRCRVRRDTARPGCPLSQVPGLGNATSSSSGGFCR